MYEAIQKSVDRFYELCDHPGLDIETVKIRQKLEEARYNPGAVRPLADCIYSILVAARSQGVDTGAVMKELERVADDNMKRKWKKMPDGTHRGFFSE